jgi:FtsP/CotA-like multicopper oxidase with cupredoxin domain
LKGCKYAAIGFVSISLLAGLMLAALLSSCSASNGTDQVNMLDIRLQDNSSDPQDFMRQRMSLPAERKAAAERFKAMRATVRIREMALGLPVTIAPPVLDPGGLPHYYGPWPNYANSPMPKGAVTNITLEDGGVGYTNPTITIMDVYYTNTANATATATVSGGVITDITLNDGGSDYTAPIVTITDATGTGAVATATIGGTPGSLTGGIRKFVDPLPNIPIAVPDRTAYPAGGIGYTSAPAIIITDATGTGAAASANLSGNTVSSVNVTNGGSGYSDNPIIEFVGGGASTRALGKATVVGGVITGITLLGCDYYEIELGEYDVKMHNDLPPTRLRGYRQTNMAPNPANAFSYMGPVIVAERDRPVRIKFTNNLSTGADGDLFIPVDTTVMGSGPGPNMIMAMHIMAAYVVSGATVEIATHTNHTFQVGQKVRLHGFVPDAYNGEFAVVATPDNTHFQVTLNSAPGGPATTLGDVAEMYTENRATIHLHGGYVPWISDGTPHQWITPAGENTNYPMGVSVRDIPDMPNPGDGSMTFYYNNQQSARLMFYHDHAYGITRLNVYVGEAAGYLLTDQVEQDMINGTNLSGVNPTNAVVLPDIGIPLIIQDKTFVDNTTIAAQDPTWNWGTTPPLPNTGDLWMPHVYMPNQNPYDLGGMNAFGRWHYGPWFWPPTTNIMHGPVANPYYDPVNAPWEGALNPGVPNNSMAMEAFMDTPTVNGIAYPYLEVEPRAYRFRILSVADDRFFNLQLYVADPNVTTSDGRVNTEVKMVPARATAGYPLNWPRDGREGGVPDPATAGPEIIQIGTEGGFLPAPVVLPNLPVGWNFDQTNFDFGLVNQGTLILGPAERADVIIDFSEYANKTVILYNDAPAPFPALDPRYDYYTGNGDQTDTGGTPTTQPGYGPNTRTIMQFRVNDTTPAAPYDLVTLNEVFAKTDGKRGVFEASQDEVIIPQAAYNSAYNKSFPVDTYVRIFENSKTFQTVSGDTVTLPFEAKAIQDEMGEAFDIEYGRMSGFLGLEVPFTGAGNQNFLLYPFPSPPVEIIKGSVYGTPIGSTDDGTQIWKITHNGVDTHTIHVHLFNAQLINRVAWDNAIRPPDANELGWKETFRVNPLQDTIVAFRAIPPTQPFDVPNSVRLIDPTKPDSHPLMGGPLGFQNPDAEPVNVVNHLVNYGWEYVYHCHLLSHEEMDMMHAMGFAVAPRAPTNLTVAMNPVTLNWTDNSDTETNFTIERALDAGFTSGLTTFVVGPNVTTYIDVTAVPGTPYFYRVMATNVVGDTWDYSDPNINEGDNVRFPTVAAHSDPSNTVAAGPDRIGVFDPSSGLWFLDYDNDGVADKAFYYGATTHKPVTGDWNGDGTDTVGVFDPATGLWFLDYDNDGVADQSVYFGASTHIPVTGDWNGDGTDTVGVFDPSTGLWFLDYDNDGAHDAAFYYGATTHIPVTGDWNGDGTDTVGVFDPATGLWFLDYDNNGAADAVLYYGATTHKPVTGDWNGDGTDTAGVFDPATGLWFLDYDNDGVADAVIPYGASTHVPVKGNWLQV